MKRRSPGLAIKKTRTLTAPERLNRETPKNVAADGTYTLRNCNHRVTDRGRMVREYAKGYLHDL